MSKSKATKRKRGRLLAAQPLLGEVGHTARGFELIEFMDCYGEKCSLQASSLAEYEKPGTSAVWLGCEEARKHPATGETLSPRMHLSRKQVAALIAHLQAWLDADTFAVSQNNQAQAAPTNNRMTYHPIDLMRLITRQQACLLEIGALMSDRHDSKEIAPLLRLIQEGDRDLSSVRSEARANDCAENDS